LFLLSAFRGQAVNQSPADRPLRLAFLALLALLAAAGLLAAAPAAAQPVFSKAFAPDTIGAGSASRLTFLIDNGNMGTPAEDLDFTDTLPAGVTLAQPPSATNTCGGVVTAPGGGTTIELSGGSLPPGEACAIAVDVTSSTAGTHTNTSGDLTSTAGNSGSATADLTVDAERPGFTKSFSADPIPLGDTVTLTFTLDHSSGTTNRTNLSFVDPLPAGLVVAGPSNAGGTCPAADAGAVTAVPGSGTISYSASGPLAPGTTCTISVDVTAVEPGLQVNRTGELSSTPGGSLQSSGFAVAAVEVTVEPLTLVKSFVDDPAAPGETVTLRFTVHNFTRDPASDIAFSDDLDATLSGLAAVGLPQNDVCGAGSQVSGTSTIGLTGGSLAGGGSCTFDVTLQVPAGAAPGTYPNTTSTVTGDVGGVPTVGSPATDDLVIAPAPILTKTITPDPALAGDELTVDFLLENPSADAIIEISFEDVFTDFIPGSTVTPPADGYCNGTGTTAVSATTILFSGIELAAGASCTFSFALQVPLDTGSGLYTNTTTEVTGLDLDEEPLTGRPASDDVSIVAAPTLEKVFVEDPVAPGATVTLRFTLTSAEGATGTATDIAFTDDLSAVLAGLMAIDTPITDVCGTGSEISGTTTLAFTGGSLAANSSCTFSVTLQVPAGAAPGAYPNTTSTVTATVDGLAVEGPAATDDLAVAGLGAAKQLTDDPAVAGGTVTLEFTLRNDDPTETVTDIAFTDDLDAVVSGLAYNGPALVDPCGAGSQLTGTSLLSFSGGSLAPGTSCTFSVVLDVPAGADAGEYANITSQVTATSGDAAIAVAPAVDSLSVVDPLTIAKEFTDDPTVAGGTVTLQITIGNAHPTEDATSVAFTDDLDAALSGLQAVGTPLVACGGTLTGTSVLSFSGGTVPAADSCIVTVTLQVPAAVPAGTTATNTTSPVTGTIDGVEVSGAAASDDLLVEVADLSKSFDGPTTATGTAVLTFTIENLGTDPLTDLAFTDDLSATLAGLTAVGLPMNDVCGAGSSIGGTSFLTFSGGSLAAEASCTFDVTVQVPAGAAAGSYTNTTSELAASGIAIALPASDELEIEPAPAFDKSFSPATVGEGVPSTLTFTIDNTASALAATGLDFTDDLPAGVVLADSPNASTTCTGGTLGAVAGSGTVSYTGGTVAAGATCTVSVDVTAAATGSYVNTSGALTSSSGSSGTASSTLTVRPAPTVTKTFAPDVIAAGGTSTVTVTIDNSANLVAATNVTFLDMLPAGVVVAAAPNAATTCTGGTVTASPGAGSFGYSGGTVSGGASCTVSVDVAAAAAGSYENSVTVSSSLGSSSPASDTLTVSGAPLVVKAFSPAEIGLGETTTVVITIDNTAGALPVSGLSFTDTLPAGMTVADPANASTTCTGGTVTAVPGAGSFEFAGGSVAAGGSCTVMVDVTADELGPAENVVVVDSSLGTSPAAAAVLLVTGSILEIPTAGTWALLMLAMLLAANAVWRLRA
jgi:uncharacterized repeat protein (TIGR01451 family)